jgi:hypothetical protein
MNISRLIIVGSLMLWIGCVAPLHAGAIILDPPLDPQISAAAGRFDGDRFFLDVVDERKAIYGDSVGVVAAAISPERITGTGAARASLPGEGALAEIAIWFTLTEPEPYRFTSTGTGGNGYHNFDHGLAELFIYDSDTRFITKITESRGVLDPFLLAPSESYLIWADAIATKAPDLPYSLPPIDAEFSFELVLGRSALVPLPAGVWLFLAGAAGLYGIAIRKNHNK